MSKKNATPSPITRENLAEVLDSIRQKRETEEKSFRDALEKLYDDHRKAMKALAEERKSAWEKYAAGRKAEKPAPKKEKKAPKAKAAPAAEVTPEA